MRTIQAALIVVAATAAPGASAPLDQDQAPVAVVNLVRPEYPPIAQSARVQGQVTVALVIRRDGSVAEASVDIKELGAAPIVSSQMGEAARVAAVTSRFGCHGCT